MKIKYSYCIILSLFILLFFLSCTDTAYDMPETFKLGFVGQISNQYDEYVENVLVRVGNSQTTTNVAGIYNLICEIPGTLDDYVEDNLPIFFSKEGYTDVFTIVDILDGQTSYGVSFEYFKVLNGLNFDKDTSDSDSVTDGENTVINLYKSGADRNYYLFRFPIPEGVNFNGQDYYEFIVKIYISNISSDEAVVDIGALSGNYVWTENNALLIDYINDYDVVLAYYTVSNGYNYFSISVSKEQLISWQSDISLNNGFCLFIHYDGSDVTVHTRESAFPPEVTLYGYLEDFIPSNL